MAKRILVTGGAGFIGSHLCTRLVNEGHDVICLDNYFTGRKENIASLYDKPNFELIRHDIIQPIMLEIDEIYHLACPASPVHYQYNPIKTIKTAFMGTLNMLGLAVRTKARILVASTSEIYGDPAMSPQTESYWGNVNPIGIRSCYDEGKRISETLCFDYYRQNQVQIRVARIFNTYGPNMAVNDGRVVSNFIVQALKGENITIYGDGSQTRSFCYVDDLVQGFIQLMASNEIGPFNLGNPEEIPIKTLAERVLAKIDTSSIIVYENLPQDDPKQRKPDITKATEFLKWQPTIPLDKGLDQAIAYFRQRISEAKT